MSSAGITVHYMSQLKLMQSSLFNTVIKNKQMEKRAWVNSAHTGVETPLQLLQTLLNCPLLKGCPRGPFYPLCF